MRKALLLATSVLALAVGATALAAATRVVAIKSTGFSPVTRTIQTGDSIRWRNDDTVNHQVVADNGLFASPVLRPRASYTKLFTTSGTYKYRDALKPSSRGTIVVKGPPPSVSIAATAGVVFWGAPVRLTGQISSGAANQVIQIWARPWGQTSFVKQADVATVTGGLWDFSETPQVLTEYYARWGSRQSVTASVGVRPRLTLIRRAPWFVTSVKAGGTSFAGRFVYVQRKSSLGQWVNVKKVIIGSSGARRFKLNLARGRHAVRIFLTTNQAGSGYLWSNSRTIVFRKRTK
jgi:plastocyanin